MTADLEPRTPDADPRPPRRVAPLAVCAVVLLVVVTVAAMVYSARWYPTRFAPSPTPQQLPGGEIPP